MKQLTLAPVESVSGQVTLPGSKSLSNRALLLSALARGQTHLINLLRSDDTSRMVDALRQLGVAIDMSEDWHDCIVSGRGGLFQSPNETTFDLGNAGTAIRPLTAMLALMPGTFTIDGDRYMRERPIEHLTDALCQLGARVKFLGKAGCPPLQLTGGRLRGGKISIPGNISSQFLTSLLLALPLAEQDSEITVIGEQVSKPYLDITLDIMAKFGATARHRDYRIFNVPGGQSYVSPGNYLIEGDASSATYFFAAAAIKGGPVRVHGLGRASVQGDIRFLDVIEAMGAEVECTDDWIEVRGGALEAIDMDLNHIPDAAMTVAAMALFARGTTVIRNIYNWRVKETDRMTAVAAELRKLGASVETGEDFIIITPPDELRDATIDTYGDHRMAMAFSLAALGNATITINDPDCTSKTFPDYFEVFASLT